MSDIRLHLFGVDGVLLYTGFTQDLEFSGFLLDSRGLLWSRSCVLIFRAPPKTPIRVYPPSSAPLKKHFFSCGLNVDSKTLNKVKIKLDFFSNKCYFICCYVIKER